jgi:hypothetical protein
MLLPGAIPVSLLAIPGSDKAKKMTATSGRLCLASSKDTGLLGYCVKTLTATSAWDSTMCLLTWKVRYTPQGRLLFQLVPKVLRTEEIGSGLWATPTANDAKNLTMLPSQEKRNSILGQILRMWPTPTTSESPNRNIENQLVNGRQIHLSESVRMWPTPRAQGGHATEGLIGRNKSNLEEVVADMGDIGRLNPEWVEALMGYPKGWTDLDSPGIETGNETCLES